MDITPSDIKKITDSSYDYEIEYLDKENNETTRRISPIRSFEYRDNDYLEAYCHLRKENRNFLCSSIVSFEISSVIFSFMIPVITFGIPPISSGIIIIGNTIKHM